MSFQNENIGMMDEGYFVSRGDILKWLNDLLQLNLSKIEQLGSGAVYCQVVDVIHPGKVAMNKVNWKAKNDYQFIGNLKILQDSFNKIGIKRYVQVEKLAKAKYQDNLEFAQWLKRYYDLNCGDRGNNYLAEERRGGLNPDFGFAEKVVVPKTYNGTGVIIPKKEGAPIEKKETVPELPPKKAPVSSIPRVSQQQQSEPRPKKVQVAKGGSGSNEKEQQLLKKMKDMQDKLLMITEILHSEENSDMKIHMISEIVNLQEQKEKEEEMN